MNGSEGTSGKQFARTFLVGLISFIVVMSIVSSAIAAAQLTLTPEDSPSLTDSLSAYHKEEKDGKLDASSSELEVLSFSVNQMTENYGWTEYVSISGGNPHIEEANLSGEDVVLDDYGESVCDNLSYDWRKRSYGYWDEVTNYYCVEGQLPYDQYPYMTKLSITFSRVGNASEYNQCTIFLEYINVTIRRPDGNLSYGYQSEGGGGIGSWSGNTFTASWDKQEYYHYKGNLSVTLSQKPGPKPIVLKASKDGYASVEKEIDNAENFAQIDLSGVAFDEKTGELLEGAKIEILEGANPAATTTDLHGNYSLTAIIPGGSGSAQEEVYFELPPAEYIVGVYEITTAVLDLIEDNNGTVIDQTINEDWPQALLVKISNETDIEPFIDNVNKSDSVQYVQRNFIIHALHVPNDERYTEQWGPQSIFAGGLPDPSAWDYEQGMRSVLIAIIDSGIQYDHPDLHRFEDGALKYVYGYDWIDMDNDPYPMVDAEDHGTMCTGIATAIMDNNMGIAGIAPNCSLIAERIFRTVFNPGINQWRYVGDNWILGFAIMDAASYDADVISMSLGGPLPADVLEEFFERFACQYAIAQGCILVAASGNEALLGEAGTIDFPAAYPTVIAVGAIDRNNVRADFSQWGPELELVAPGTDILTTEFRNVYEFRGGTSAATPHVSGVAALVKSRAERWPEEPFVANPKYHLNNNQIREVLILTATDLGPPGWDQEYGHGKVDAVHAVLCVNLSGTVREALNNASIPHPPLVPAPPRVNVTSIEGPPGNYSTFEDTHLARLTEEGDYFVRLPPGVYSVCAMAYGYYPSRGAKGDRVDLPAFDPAGQLTHEELDFTLEPFRCTVTGIVIDNETGLPIENANVSLDGPPLLIPPYSNVHLVTQTDSTGAYNFSLDYSVHQPYPIGEAVYDLNVSKDEYFSQTKNFSLNWSSVVTNYYKCPLDPLDIHQPVVNFALIPLPPAPLPDLTLAAKDILFTPPQPNIIASPASNQNTLVDESREQCKPPSFKQPAVRTQTIRDLTNATTATTTSIARTKNGDRYNEGVSSARKNELSSTSLITPSFMIYTLTYPSTVKPNQSFQVIVDTAYTFDTTTPVYVGIWDYDSAYYINDTGTTLVGLGNARFTLNLTAPASGGMLNLSADLWYWDGFDWVLSDYEDFTITITEERVFSIENLTFPATVNSNQTFQVVIDADYSFDTATYVYAGIWDYSISDYIAGTSGGDTLLGTGTVSFTFNLTAPSSGIMSLAAALSYWDWDAFDWLLADYQDFTVSVSVTEPDFTLAADPPSQTVFPGANTSYIVSLTSLNGFNMPVTLNISGLPNNVTADFHQNPVIPPNSSNVTLSTSNTTLPGNYTLTITGVGAAITRNTTVILNVTEKSLAILTATIHNIGWVDASNVAVQFFDGAPTANGTQIGTDQTLARVPAGSKRTAEVFWDVTDKVGTHIIYVRIDPNNKIAELKEDNNLAFRQIGVPGVRCADPNVTVDQTKTSVTDDPVGEGYNLSDAPANVNILNAKGFNLTATGPDGFYPFNITFSSPVGKGFVLFKLPEWVEIPYTLLDQYTIQVQLNISNGVLDPAFVLATEGLFDTGSGTYPSISGTYNGTITPDQTISVSTLYTYPCPGTGGHTEYVRIYNGSGTIAEASWSGYVGDWHNISFPGTFILRANETCNYTIKTGSYPQIIHEPSYNATGGKVTCTEFVDINGKRYEDWIPAITLF